MRQEKDPRIRQLDDSSSFDPDSFLSRESLLTLAARLVNPPRLSSARSKVGTDANRIVEEVALDALIDLRDVFPRCIEGLAADEERELVSHLEVQARTQLEKPDR